ncbi:hypothetical protein IAU59_003594 [Kwoniella sp. CBS 9459]
MPSVRTVRNILVELRKICQHPYLSEPELEPLEATEEEQHKQLAESSGKLSFLKLLLPKLKTRGHRVLLFSQFKIALDRIENFLYGEGIKFLRLDGDVQQAQRQKSMDLFNAPNSDYDVFLLTTRAGGVGINLATADTVILYDPDFNPHQDLQAIARSHRYGQKKRVLVFKLMVKGSVEENIINKGKKKMVLDHLVVQQMGKENEEGDIDDLLLRGAEAVYSNTGGMNLPDILYNSKNVDELIDKVEADAEAEAQETENRERAIANGEAEPTRSRQAAQFGFAKIWEADQNQLLAAEEAGEGGGDDADRLEVNWEQILENMRKEKALADVAQADGIRIRRMRKAAKGQYVLDTGEDLRAITPDDKTEKKKKRGRPKGKGKGKDGSMAGASLGNTSSSDADFTFNPEDAASDDDVLSVTSVPEGLSLIMTDDNGVPILHRGLVGKQRMTKHEKRLWEAARALHGPPSNDPTVPLPLPGPSNGPGTLTQAQAQAQAQAGSSNDQQNGGRPSDVEDKEARKRRRLEAKAAKAALHAHANGIVGQPPSSAVQHGSAPTANQQFAEAQHILAWLYSVIKEFGVEKDIKRWALMGLPEIPPEDREKRYRQLAEDTDNRLATIGQPRYFSLPAQINKVTPLFRARAPAVLDKPARSLPFPHNVGISTRVSAMVPQPPPPHTFTASSSAPTQAKRTSSGADLFNSLLNGAPPLCEYCLGPHQLSDCMHLPTLIDLASLREAVLSGVEPPADGEAALHQIDRSYNLLIKSGRIAAPQPLLNGHNHMLQPQPQPQHRSPAPPPHQLNGSHSHHLIPNFTNGDSHGGTRAQPISIPSSPALYPVPPRTHVSATTRTGSDGVFVPGLGAPNRFRPAIPGPPPMMAPPAASFAPAMAAAPTHHLPPNGNGLPPVCPFCEEHCGKSIRSCANWSTPDGRKAIKNKIKALQAMIDAGGDDQAIKRIQMPLYDEYKAKMKWPMEDSSGGARWTK